MYGGVDNTHTSLDDLYCFHIPTRSWYAIHKGCSTSPSVYGGIRTPGGGGGGGGGGDDDNNDDNVSRNACRHVKTLHANSKTTTATTTPTADGNCSGAPPSSCMPLPPPPSHTRSTCGITTLPNTTTAPTPRAQGPSPGPRCGAALGVLHDGRWLLLAGGLRNTHDSIAGGGYNGGYYDGHGVNKQGEDSSTGVQRNNNSIGGEVRTTSPRTKPHPQQLTSTAHHTQQQLLDTWVFDTNSSQWCLLDDGGWVQHVHVTAAAVVAGGASVYNTIHNTPHATSMSDIQARIQNHYHSYTTTAHHHHVSTTHTPRKHHPHHTHTTPVHVLIHGARVYWLTTTTGAQYDVAVCIQCTTPHALESIRHASLQHQVCVGGLWW